VLQRLVVGVGQPVSTIGVSAAGDETNRQLGPSPNVVVTVEEEQEERPNT